MIDSKELIKLATENPELPVVAFVDGDVVCGDSCGRWIGEIGSCRIGEFALFEERYYDDRDDLKDAYYNYYDEEFEGMTDDEIERLLDEKTSGMWVKAILVNVDTLSM
jgi:hypothetical protein